MKYRWPAILSIGIISFLVRLWVNFSTQLVPGINGAYYPLQVRGLLENNQLPFSDMPLIFYLQMLVVKVAGLAGFEITGQFIINTVKLVDSIGFPFILIPLVLLIRLIHPSIRFFQEIILYSFLLLSFSPNILIGDLQKNSLALVFSVASIYYLVKTLMQQKKSAVFFCILFLVLTAFTHFGTFSWLILIQSLILLFISGKKTISLLLILFLSGISIISVFDHDRFIRFFTVWEEIFKLPFLFSGQITLPDILNFILSVVLIVLLGIQLRKHQSGIGYIRKAITLSCLIALAIFSFPLLDAEYYRRFSMMSFLIQGLLLTILFYLNPEKHFRLINSFLVIVILISVVGTSAKMKAPMITQSEYAELKTIGETIALDRTQGIVVAQHGLEWWTAWALRIKIAQPKAYTPQLIQTYRPIYFLVKRSEPDDKTEKTPFAQPNVPTSARILMQSESFEFYIKE